jgi:PKD domain
MARNSRVRRDGRFAAVAAGLGLLLNASCGLDEVTVPQLSGPAETAISIKLDANPDIITADGFSTSLIVATVRGPNGEALAGRPIVFAISTTGGGFADFGTLYDVTGTTRLRASDATVLTGANGIAQVIYTAPPRTDSAGDTFVGINARPVGTDANGVIYKSVTIELKAAEPKLFPTGSGTLTCGFVVEAPLGAANCTSATECTVRTGAQVLFQDASRGSNIIRFEWFFGDGSGVDYHTDVNHVFNTPGGCPSGCDFTVTHRVTNASGTVDACQAQIKVKDTIP